MNDIMKIVGIILAIQLFIFASVHAENFQVIEIVTPEWGGFTNKDGSGLYFEVMKKAYSLSNIKVKYSFVPWARAVKYVNENKKDAMLGAYNTVKESIYPNYPIDTEYTLVVFKKEALNEWKGAESLKGKEVHWVRGYDYHEYLNVKVNWKELRDTEQALKLLKMGRIKFFLDSKNTLLPKLKELGLNESEYATKVVLTNFLYARFSRTEKSKELIKIFDTNMSKLHKSNELSRIYKKWNHQIPDYSKIK